MNGRTAKRLRKAAQDVTINQPNVSYLDYSPPGFGRSPASLVVHYIKISLGVPRKLGSCTRGIYQKMKDTNKAIRAGRIKVAVR